MNWDIIVLHFKLFVLLFVCFSIEKVVETEVQRREVIIRRLHRWTLTLVQVCFLALRSCKDPFFFWFMWLILN